MAISRSFWCIGFVTLVALGFPTGAEGSEPPVVFVGIPPQRFVIEQLVGDLVRVEVMLPPGASPATYEPSLRQMAVLESSALYFQIGAPFEGPVLAKVSTLTPDLEVVDCRHGIKLEPISDRDTHGHGTLDPHIWLDPTLMKQIARTMAAALDDTIPGAASITDTSLPKLLDSLDQADVRIRSKLKPFAGREMLVFHPAYGYFTRRYGLVQTAVESDGKAPTARRLAEAIDGLRGHHTPAIFVQPQFSETAARRIADALGCQLIVLDPLAGDYLSNLEVMADRIAAAMVN